MGEGHQDSQHQAGVRPTRLRVPQRPGARIPTPLYNVDMTGCMKMNCVTCLKTGCRARATRLSEIRS